MHKTSLRAITVALLLTATAAPAITCPGRAGSTIGGKPRCPRKHYMPCSYPQDIATGSAESTGTASTRPAVASAHAPSQGMQTSESVASSISMDWPGPKSWRRQQDPSR